MSVCCNCCVWSGRFLCGELTTHPEEPYRLWCVVVCDIETCSMRSQTSISCDWTCETPCWRGPHHASDSVSYSQPASTSQCRSQWPRDLRHRSPAARLLRSWVRIPPGAWMSVCCECCVLSGRGLCDGLTTHPEEFYRLWRVAVCNIETASMRSQTSINSDWGPLVGGDLITLGSLQVRLPISQHISL